MDKLIYTDKQITKLWNGAIIQTDEYGKFVIIIDGNGLCSIERIDGKQSEMVLQEYNYTIEQLIDIVDKYEYLLPSKFLRKCLQEFMYHERRCWKYYNVDYVYKEHHDNEFAEVKMFLSTLM